MTYLDHSATTPVDSKVLKAMEPYFSDIFGNPSSIHSAGQKAAAGVDAARSLAARFLNCHDDEVVFTSGATESNNLALRGAVKAALKAGVSKPHLIISAVEHDAILEPAADLKEEGVEVTIVPVDKTGRVDVESIKGAIKENTVLVSIMYVNSEVGIVQPIREIGKMIKKINEARMNSWQREGSAKKLPKPRTVLFHSDAVQAANYFDCDVSRLYVDLLSLSGHKVYGPKGTGLLYIKKGSAVSPIVMGGHHERNYRSGTLNVAGIVGLGAALSLITPEAREKNNKKIAALRDLLVEGLIKKIPNIVLNTNRDNATSSHAHFSMVGAEGESILISLDFEGIAVSTGSACASNSLKGSHVLEAMGIEEEYSNYALRFTLGKNNSKEDIKKVLNVLPPIIAKLRKMNPVYKESV
jgi:cysteine desulfurase